MDVTIKRPKWAKQVKLLLVSHLERRRAKDLQNNRACYIGRLLRKAFTMPGANSRQEVTDRAYRSPTLFRDVIASKKAVLRVRNFSEIDSIGSKGAKDNPSDE